MTDKIEAPKNGFAAPNNVAARRWRFGALAVAALYSTLALRLAFRAGYLVQDDARQHVFWMRRFIDPALFPNDLIADYFQAVAPAGYKAIYWLFAKAGVDPLLFSKILPAVIGLLIACLAFQLFLELTPNPRGAFFASLFLGQLVWLKDDVISATPRAFVCPLFLGFILFLLRGRLRLCLVVLALQAFVYPQVAFVSLGVLGVRLIEWKKCRPLFTRDRRHYLLFFAALVIFAAAILPFASSAGRFGPAISRQEARALPEFQAHGRSQFFVAGLSYWVDAPRSGLLPNGNPPHILLLALAAPIALRASRRKFRGLILLQATLAATAMWGSAHVFLFKLHLPGRYSQWLFQILFALGAAAAIAVLWDLAENWRERLRQQDAIPAARAVGLVLMLLSAALIAYPHLKKKFPDDSYVSARPRELYDFLRAQPKATLIATLRNIASLAPVFAQRSVLVSAEHAIPYHKRYYDVIRRRGRELVRAQFTPSRAELRDFIERDHVDLIIIGRSPLASQDIKKLHWFGEIADDLQFKEPPALLDFIDSSKIWENDAIIVLDAHRIAQMIQP